MSGPKTFVCAGGGGVGKTTTSAALALALARGGARTLVVTIDPARRLADALGVPIGPSAHVVTIDPRTEDRFFALMPDPERSTATFMEILFEDSPASLERLAGNALYQALLSALAGMHEVVCMALIERAAAQARFDAIVIDTAPSRHALDFVGYPARLAALLEAPALAFLADLAAPKSSGANPFAWARRGVEAALGKMLGTRLIVDLAGIFQEMAVARERFASLARGCEAVLTATSARYLLVAAPTGSGVADAKFLDRRLRRMNLRAHAMIHNRADVAAPSFVEGLAHVADPHVRGAIEALETERRSRTEAGARAERDIRGALPDARCVRLPWIAADEPADVVRRLSRELEPMLAELGG